MKSLLDLIQEWAALDEAKTRAGGALPLADEERWSELKDFYELLMSQNGLCSNPFARYSASEIREKVSKLSQLRVRTDLEIVVMKDDEVHTARVGNLSCGGVLLLSDAGFPAGTGLLLHLANVSRGAQVLTTHGDVVWNQVAGSGNGTFRYRMGVRFTDLGDKEERSLQAYVVDSLETQLLSLSRSALPAELVAREGLAI